MENEQNNQYQQPTQPQAGTGPEPAQYAQPAQPDQPAQAAQAEENPNKNYLVALLLSYLLGTLGADRFYLGKIGTGIAKLLTFGGLGIWHLIDMLLVAFNKLHEKGDERPLEGYAKNRSWVKILAVILLIFNVLVIAGILFALTLTTFSGVQTKARDTERQTDLNTIRGQLEAYYSENATYPTLEQLNDASFRSANLKGLDSENLKDPQGSEARLSSSAGQGVYAYETSPAGCTAAASSPCTSHALTATREEGSPLVLRGQY